MPADDHRIRHTRQHGRRRRRQKHGRSVLAALVGCLTLVPAVLAVTAGTASAATYPDNVAQPVNFRDAGAFGPAGGLTLNAPPVGMAPTTMARGTGSSPRTAASSTTATRPSSDRPARSH